MKNEEVASILAHGTLIHVVGAGHCVRRDKKQACLDAFRAFLSKLE